jgi:diguanylate cyclase (GGDEF)-like protein
MLRIKRMHDHLAVERTKLERMSVHDEMTGFYNYRYLSTRLAQEFKRAERYHEPFACVIVDIDQLRNVNDAFGRSGGDAAIRRVADTIRSSTRDVDVVARYGGEEFLIVLPSTHFAGSVAISERIWREAGDHAFDFEGRPIRLTVSIGISLYPSRDIRTKDALLRAADAAVSQAKREGGNRICVFQQQGHIFTPLVGTQTPSGRHAPESATSPSRTDGPGRKPL